MGLGLYGLWVVGRVLLKATYESDSMFEGLGIWVQGVGFGVLSCQRVSQVHFLALSSVQGQATTNMHHLSSASP